MVFYDKLILNSLHRYRIMRYVYSYTNFKGFKLLSANNLTATVGTFTKTRTLCQQKQLLSMISHCP